MMSKFPVQVGVVLAGMVAMSAYPLARWGSADTMLAAGAGALISTGNVLLGWLAVERTVGRSFTTFLRWVIGGMGIRLALMLAALLVLITAGGLDPLALVVSTMICYAAFMVLELLYIQKKVSAKTNNSIP